MKPRLIIGVDYDKTIITTEGDLLPNVKQVLNKWYKQGIFIQIHSCRNGSAEWELATRLFDESIPYHVINDHAPWIKEEYFNPHHPISRKLYHHILVDDTSLNFMYGEVLDWLMIDEKVQSIIQYGNWNVNPNFDVHETV